MGVTNSWIDLLEDIQFVVDYLHEGNVLSVSGIYQPLRESLCFKHATKRHHGVRSFSVRRHNLEFIMVNVILWQR